MAQQSLLKRLLVVSVMIMIVSLLPAYSFCEIQTITHTVKQPFGGSQSPDDARIAAVAKAKREALEMAGVYVEALTIVKDAKVDKDEVLALTAGVLQAEVISQKNYHTDDAFGIEIIVKVKVDTSILEDRVKKMLQDKTHIQQLKQIQAREKVLLNKVAKLEKENQQLARKGQSTKKLKKQFQEASQGLTAVDWFYKADSLWADGKYTYSVSMQVIEYLNQAIRVKPDFVEAYNNRGAAYKDIGQYQRAIEDFNQAIRLKPDYANALNNRGIAYTDLRQYQRAIEDFNQAIRLKPDYAKAHNNRGIAYRKFGQYQRAIDDYNEAIRLKDDDADTYYNRGHVYADLGQYQRAIEDYNQAIRLQPDYAEAYGSRGNAYSDLGQYQRAIDDFTQAIRLKPDLALAHNNRGIAYRKTGQYQRAIEDYNQAIRLQPDDAEAYVNLGNAYLLSGNIPAGCRSLIKGCEMGSCRGYEFYKQEGDCR